VFAASVVLHELLTGEAVYRGDSVYAIARAIVTMDVPPPSKVRGEPLPAGLDAAVMTGLRRDPAQRFESALAMAEELERIAELAGGDSLERYAHDELAEARNEHRDWLRAILDQVAPRPRAAGRASGVQTAIGASPPAARDETVGPAEHIADARGGATDAELRTLARSRWTPARLVSAVAVLAIAGLVWWRATLPTESPAVAVSRDAGALHRAIDAAVAEAPAAETPIADAGTTVVVRPLDAGPAAIARSRVRDRRARPAAVARPDVSLPKPSPDPDPAPSPTGWGHITIAADPYALVRLDGSEIGTTPIFKRRIAVGTHEITLVHPDTGAVRLRKTVEIQDGKLEKIVAR
jgi:serine/threonine-protein kinase